MNKGHPGNFPPAFSGVLIADAPGLIKTILGARPLGPATFSKFTGWTERFEAPERQRNDDAKHLRLIAQALRGQS